MTQVGAKGGWQSGSYFGGRIWGWRSTSKHTFALFTHREIARPTVCASVCVSVCVYGDAENVSISTHLWIMSRPKKAWVG